ncbi:hypothetical protein A2755_00250 [Candidatus Wolfebacteria bacterium RIFCSPHIGHO2_01_FULL_48_22]|uniref:D-alanyl-D-alanine carboxypeptidase-like core domain-containing protein n=1 Tax=Candidatus Wolfebacteria bacterium RIFCSPHIGHO2_01_FULL_48_22 TaxID=1802555 RepID=A0A1F8DV74_9BACT|nr:MAG: hypothetical protein A2755_00250 [Candidatus Wolfebacteria bacterium RIFCSPHIGHO2_01_FULL_48_22]
MAEKDENYKKMSALIAGGVIMLAAIGYGVWQYMLLQTHADEQAARIASLESERDNLAQELTKTQNDNRTLSEALYSEQQKNAQFERQLEDLASTVGRLDKLSKTDEELLQKYSKVYFLNENYIPKKLSQIEQNYIYGSKDIYFHAEALQFLEDLMEEAKDDGINLSTASAYRSFDTQSGLKSTYQVYYGSGANAFSADQGYSEHQLGTAVDFTSEDIQGGLDGFQQTEAYEWLLKNGYKYGFVLSYPEENAYYVFEPWHWRFVGVELARDLHRQDKYFYDLDQREIDGYLISIFD